MKSVFVIFVCLASLRASGQGQGDGSEAGGDSARPSLGRRAALTLGAGSIGALFTRVPAAVVTAAPVAAPRFMPMTQAGVAARLEALESSSYRLTDVIDSFRRNQVRGMLSPDYIDIHRTRVSLLGRLSRQVRLNFIASEVATAQALGLPVEDVQLATTAVLQWKNELPFELDHSRLTNNPILFRQIWTRFIRDLLEREPVLATNLLHSVQSTAAHLLLGFWTNEGQRPDFFTPEDRSIALAANPWLSRLIAIQVLRREVYSNLLRRIHRLEHPNSRSDRLPAEAGGEIRSVLLSRLKILLVRFMGLSRIQQIQLVSNLKSNTDEYDLIYTLNPVYEPQSEDEPYYLGQARANPGELAAELLSGLRDAEALLNRFSTSSIVSDLVPSGLTQFAATDHISEFMNPPGNGYVIASIPGSGPEHMLAERTLRVGYEWETLREYPEFLGPEGRPLEPLTSRPQQVSPLIPSTTAFPTPESVDALERSLWNPAADFARPAQAAASVEVEAPARILALPTEPVEARTRLNVFDRIRHLVTERRRVATTGAIERAVPVQSTRSTCASYFGVL